MGKSISCIFWLTLLSATTTERLAAAVPVSPGAVTSVDHARADFRLAMSMANLGADAYGPSAANSEAKQAALVAQRETASPIDHRTQRYYHCFFKDLPPDVKDGEPCRFYWRDSLKVLALIERKWTSHLLKPMREVDVTYGSTSKGSSCRIPTVRPKPLMDLGPEPVRTIVFVALGGGQLCAPDTHDWRANLPKYIGRFANANVIIYGQTSNSCKICHRAGRGSSEGCASLLTRGADMLVIIGSGHVWHTSKACLPSDLAPGRPWCEHQFQDLWELLSHKWAQSARLVVHFPIRNVKRLMNNEVFDFDSIVDDGSFLKPSSPCAYHTLSECRKSPGKRSLVYVGRMTVHKGQVRFLKNVDPKLLSGYTVEFFGEVESASEERELRKIAEQKGIKVKLHGTVSKEQLFKGLCSAQGMIMYAIDKNPRAVYEGVSAGLPLFVAEEAQVAEELAEQPFVTVTARNHEGPEAEFQAIFNQDFALFMHTVRSGLRAQIGKWADSHLQDEAVYLSVCQRLCLCKSELPHCVSQQYKPRRRVTATPKRKPDTRSGILTELENALLLHPGTPKDSNPWAT